MRTPLVPLVLLLSACLGDPPAAPPLAGMIEPLARKEPPDDEAERRALPAGSFTGIRVGDARATLDAMFEEPEGLLVTDVVENSPADAAGVEIGDLLLAAWIGGDSSRALRWPADWRALELDAEPGATVAVTLDRAGDRREASFAVVARVRPAEAPAISRFREEEKVGVVLRTASEVEARSAGLGPGGGAVIVGLTRESPWRPVGLVYGDLIVAVDEADVAHPEVLLQAIRNASSGDALALDVVRDGRERRVDAPVSRRERELTEVSIPLVFSYSRERDTTSTSLLFGLFARTATPAAWKLRLLWLLSFAGGDADRLEELGG